MSNDLITAVAVDRAISHTSPMTVLLRSLYAEAIAAELTYLAEFGERVTPDLLRQRAAFLRDGIRRDAKHLVAELSEPQEGGSDG